MAQKRKEIPPPPPKAADRDEEEQSGEEEEESDEEVELPLPSPALDESDESDDEEGSDSESESEAAPNPLAETADGKKLVAETKAEDKKDTAEKTSKKKDGAAATEKLFQRLYTEEDEVSVLEGMVVFKEETGKNAMDDMNGFYAFVKSKIHVAVSQKQFVHKIKRLKLRFDKNVKKGKSTFAKDHEQKLYDVSCQIWGHEIATGGSLDVAVTGKKRKKGHEASKANDQEVKVVPAKKKLQHEQDVSIGSLCLTELINSQGVHGARVSEDFLKRALHALGDEVTAEYDAKWRNLLVAESKLVIRRAELSLELMNLAVDAVEASDQ